MIAAYEVINPSHTAGCLFGYDLSNEMPWQ